MIMMIDLENEVEEVGEFPENLVGELKVEKETLRKKEVHWTIENVLSLCEAHYHIAPFFVFLNVRWYLRFDPIEADSEDYVALDIKMDDVGLVYNMLCTFGIQKADGSLVGAVSYKHMFCDKNLKLAVPRFFTRTELWERRKKLMPSNKLTIVCCLKQLPSPTKLTEFNLLSEKIKALLTGGEFCDVILHVKGKEFKAHRIILAARSPVFASYFKHETLEKENGVVNIPDIDPDSFPAFLKYLYSGEIENISFRSALHLYKTADKYDVQELKLFCVEHMEQDLTLDNFFDVLYLAESHDDRTLLDAAQHFFNCNFGEIFATDEWKNLMKNNCNLVSKLLMEMSSSVEVVLKRRRLQ